MRKKKVKEKKNEKKNSYRNEKERKGNVFDQLPFPDLEQSTVQICAILIFKVSTTLPLEQKSYNAKSINVGIETTISFYNNLFFNFNPFFNLESNVCSS